MHAISWQPLHPSACTASSKPRMVSVDEYSGGGHVVDSMAAAIRPEPCSRLARPCTRLELRGGALPGNAQAGSGSACDPGCRLRGSQYAMRGGGTAEKAVSLPRKGDDKCIVIKNPCRKAGLTLRISRLRSASGANRLHAIVRQWKVKSRRPSEVYLRHSFRGLCTIFSILR
jgi:hypothetical protein